MGVSIGTYAIAIIVIFLHNFDILTSSSNYEANAEILRITKTNRLPVNVYNEYPIIVPKRDALLLDRIIAGGQKDIEEEIRERGLSPIDLIPNGNRFDDDGDFYNEQAQAALSRKGKIDQRKGFISDSGSHRIIAHEGRVRRNRTRGSWKKCFLNVITCF